MILFIILLLMFAVLLGITISSIVVGGLAFLLVFGDVILFVLIIVWIVKRLTGKNKKKWDQAHMGLTLLFSRNLQRILWRETVSSFGRATD